MTENKKPWHKKWRVWAIGIFLLWSVIGSTGKTEQSKTTDQPASNAEQATTSKEATPAMPVEKAPDPINLSGTGQQATAKFALKQGLSVFKMTYKGSSNFAPTLLDGADGETVDLLANEIGQFTGSKAVGIKREGQYLIDVTASGPWTIAIEQPRASDAPATRSFSGTTQEATALFSLKKGLNTFKMNHAGKGNWAPTLLDARGEVVDLLANEIGSFNGSKAVNVPRDGVYLMNVTANGNWSIIIE
jgi:hypothetical protein